MSSLEGNKIIGAILFTALAAMAISTIGNALIPQYHVKHEKATEAKDAGDQQPQTQEPEKPLAELLAAATPEAGLDWAWRSLTRMPRPYDVVVLGMGEDGHIASLFPGSLGIARALDANVAPACVAMHGLVAPHARISQNLAALLDARRMVLLITGDAKWSVYQRAKLAGPLSELPVRAIVQQQQTPIDVFWSPS